MRNIHPMSLWARLKLLVLVAIIPLFALLVYTNAEQRRRDMTAAGSDARTDVEFTSLVLELKLEETHDLLRTLAQSAELRGPDLAACAARLAELSSRYSEYAELGLAGPQGDILCSSSTTRLSFAQPNQKGTAWFQRALSQRAFSTGNFQVEPDSGRPVLTFGLPLLDQLGNVQGVVYAIRPVSQLYELPPGIQSSPQADVLLLDRNGIILDRQPQPENWVGKLITETPLVQTILTQQEGVAELRGIDGISRLYAFAPVRHPAGTGLYVCAGIPTGVVYAGADQTLLLDLLALVPSVALALVTASFFANRLFGQHVNSLTEATQRLRSGDLSARSPALSQITELDQLAVTFNETASALEQREVQHRVIEDNLREQYALLHTTLTSMGDAMIIVDAQGQITFMNPIAAALTGWPQDEAVGQPVETVFALGAEGSREAHENLTTRISHEGATLALSGQALLSRHTGHTRSVDMSGSPIRSAAGEINGAVFVFRDITERQRAEHRLLIQHAVARLLAESGSVEEIATRVLGAICQGAGWDAGVLWRIEQGVPGWNFVASWQAADLPASELLAMKSDLTLSPGRDLPERALAENQAVWTFAVEQERQYQHTSAAQEPRMRTGLALPIRSGQAVVGILECLSRQSLALEEEAVTTLEVLSQQLGNFIERKSAEEALYETSMVMQAVFDSTTDNIFVKDRQGRYLLANSAMARSTGRLVQEIIGQDDTALYPLETAQQIIAADQQVMISGQIQTLEETITLPADIRIYHSVKAPYRDVHGNVIGLIGISRDVTHLTQSTRAQQLLAETSRLLATSLDDESRLAKVAKLLVPDLADWCLIEVIADDQTVGRVAAEHADRAKAALAEELYRRHPPDWNMPGGVAEVLRSGQPKFFPDLDDASSEGEANTSRHLKVLRELGLKSAISVPMNVYGLTLGVLTLGWSAASRPYTADDLALAQEVANRCALALDNARLYQAESAARAAAQVAQQRLAFLAGASRVLMSSTEVNTQVDSLAQYIVPTFADWCAIHLIEPDGSLRLAAVNHRDPDKTHKISEWVERYPDDPAVAGTLRVVRTGLPETSSRIFPDRLGPMDDPGDYEYLLEELGFKSYMIVPLKARGTVSGTLLMVSVNTGRPYTQADLTLAEELAAYAALAVDGARSYQEAQLLNAELDRRVKERTALLQANNEKLQEQIAERLRAEAELAEVQRQQAQGRESERSHLARELHDGPVQDLYGISYRLAVTKDSLQNDSALEQFAAAQAELQRVIHTLRNISSELRPPALTFLGLRVAIRAHAERFQLAHPELQIHLDLTSDRHRLAEEVRLALFRIYQQTVSNIVRHAHAQQVHVRLRLDTHAVTLEIQDDGRGFEVPRRWIDLARKGHLGLIGAAERAEALDGTLKVNSATGQGTQIIVSIPLDGGRPADLQAALEDEAI